jgi:hypothetical protein
MSALTSLAKARAFEEGRAVPIATRRHVHLSDRPLVFVPLALAGEANAPLACLVGTSASEPTLLVVPQPRNRDLRFAFAASLASVVLSYVDLFARADEINDAPQVVVANPAGVAFTRLLGRSTRFRRTTGEYAVHESVPLLGRWLTFLAERTMHPGSSSLLPMTSVLASHWATGQSALEDANLAALMAWIDPPPGRSAVEAARTAEDPLVWPPAGPTTDPTFDNEVLAPLIRAYDAADETPGAVRRATVALESALRAQMEPTWHLLWRAIDLLRTLPPGPSVADRWRRECRTFANQVAFWRDGGPPQARVDQAVAAARRLAWLEQEQNDYEVDTALDDPLVMAEFRLTGEAFAGTVVGRDPTRLDRSGARAKPRPHILIRTADPVRLEPGVVVRDGFRRSQNARVVDVVHVTGAVEVTLELQNGMGHSRTPAPGTVPELDEAMCYSTLSRESGRPAPFPPRERTPWTHGGPPPEYQPRDEDAGEAWS